MNIISLLDRFNSEDACLDYLESLRWPRGVACPRCGDMGATEIKDRRQWDCKGCEYHFSVTSGTIIHDSHLPIRKWLLAIYLMCESKKGISARQLHRQLGIGSYRTAWYLSHRIRKAMGNNPFTGPTLFGVVEVDETLVGGKKRNVGSGSKEGKTWIAGAIQRETGQIRVERIPNIKRHTLHDFIGRTVTDGAEAIYTDELKSYVGIGDPNTRHETVSHSAEEWVVGDVHTNGIEGVWSLFKRSIIGTFHKMSLKHMDRYLEELEWRFNNRDNPNIFRDTMERVVNTGTLTYKELVA